MYNLINEQAYLEINFRMLWTSKSVIPVHYLLTTLVTVRIIEGLKKHGAARNQYSLA